MNRASLRLFCMCFILFAPQTGKADAIIMETISKEMKERREHFMNTEISGYSLSPGLKLDHVQINIQVANVI